MDKLRRTLTGQEAEDEEERGFVAQVKSNSPVMESNRWQKISILFIIVSRLWTPRRCPGAQESKVSASVSGWGWCAPSSAPWSSLSAHSGAASRCSQCSTPSATSCHWAGEIILHTIYSCCICSFHFMFLSTVNSMKDKRYCIAAHSS